MGSELWNWLSGMTMIVVVGVVLSNGRAVADIFTGLGNLYGNVAAAAVGGHYTNRALP